MLPALAGRCGKLNAAGLMELRGRAGSPHPGLPAVPISARHSCGQGDRSTGSFSFKGRGGCSRVWGGHGTGVTGREGERQHTGTDASYVWLLLRPPARIGGASAVDVTDGEAGP